MEREKKPQPIYKEASDRLRHDAVKKDLAEKVFLLQGAENRGRVDLKDVAAVKAVSREYLERCQQTGQIPTVMALAASLGCSRRWLNLFCQENPNHPTTQFLEVLKEIFADTLTQAGLSRYLSESLSIFILKNCASMADKIELEPVAPSGPMSGEVDRAALENRIAGSVVLDEDDY